MNNKVAVLNTNMSLERFVKENPRYEYSAEDSVIRSRNDGCWAFVFCNEEPGKIHLTAERHVPQDMMFDLLYKYGGEFYEFEGDTKPTLTVPPMDILKRHGLDQWGDETFPYRMLDRMRSDCEYYLGAGARHVKYLWASDEREHIACMKEIWRRLPEDGKPEWLPYEKILEYEKQMCSPGVERVIREATEKSVHSHGSCGSKNDMERGR